MVRFLSVAAAALVSATLLSATAGHAQTVAGAYYVATPAAAPGKPSFITRETLWKWQDGAYIARKSPERDATLCALVAQRTGKLSAFSVNGASLPAADLDKCNARAG